MSKHAVCLFAYAFCSAAAYVVGRAVADGLYVSELGADSLPLMHVVSALVMGGLAAAYLRLARFVRAESLVRVVYVMLAVGTLSARLILERSPHDFWTLSALYILAEVRGGLGTIMLGTLMNERVRVEEAKHSFGFIGAGATLAGIVFGGLVGSVAGHLHAANLLYVTIGMELLAVIPISLSARTFDGTVTGFGKTTRRNRLSRLRRNSRRRNQQRHWFAAIRTPFGAALAVGTALQTFIALCVDYQWKSSASQTFLDADQLTTFFGRFYAVVYFVTALLQLTLTGRMLRSQGQRTTLFVFPAGLWLATFAIAFPLTGSTLVWGATMSKGCDTLKRAFHDPAVQLLYSPMSTAKRRRLIALIVGVVKPFSEATAGAMILQSPTFLRGTDLSRVTLVLITVWIVTLWIAQHRHDAANPTNRQ